MKGWGPFQSSEILMLILIYFAGKAEGGTSISFHSNEPLNQQTSNFQTFKGWRVTPAGNL
jgi:hypothetical protein